jgi:hypothetical protein
MPRIFLHLEGAAILILAIALYANMGFSWWAFALFLLAPDLAFVFYPISPRLGSIVYNLVHTYAFPLALGVFSFTSGSDLGIQVTLIWLAHIGMDRLFGYGFKYMGEAKATHFSNI